MRCTKLTPNLVVRDVAASLAFYRDVLGFEIGFTVPDAPPHVFGSVRQGEVEIFFNDRHAAAKDHPPFAEGPVGGTLTLFIEVDDLDGLVRRLDESGVPLLMPVTEQWYGMRECAVVDPEGWILTFAQPLG